MEQIIKDWLGYCENPKSFNSSHFFTLFMDDNPDEEIKTILNKFPNSDLLFSNFKSIRTIATDEEKLKSSKEFLLELAKADIEQKIMACELINEQEFVQELKKLNYYFIDDNDEFNLIFDEDHLFTNFVSNVSFFVNAKRKYKNDTFYGLEEALYGYTNDYQLTWHVLAPLISTNVDFSNYYNFIDRGGDYVISKKGVFVTKLE